MSYNHSSWNMLMTLLIEREVAERSVLIKNMMEDIGEQAVEDAIPIPNVSPLPVQVYTALLTNSQGQRGRVE